MPETPFLADDGLPDFDPKASLRDLSLQRMKEQVQTNPFAMGVAQGRPGKPPTHFLDNPAPRPQDPLLPVYEALSPAQQGYGLGQAVGGAAAHATHGRLMDAALEMAPLVAAMAIPGAPKGGGRGVKVRPEIPRELDSMGFYSQALEAAKAWPQPRGTPEQVLAALKQAGVKDAEIKATNLQSLLEGKPSVTREELVQHLRENRVQLQEGRYGARSPTEVEARSTEIDPLKAEVRRLENETHRLYAAARDGTPEAGQLRAQAVASRKQLLDTVDQLKAAEDKWSASAPKKPKWDSTYGGQDLSLGGPGNPSYRESVYHLPPAQERAQIGEMKPFGAEGTQTAHYGVPPERHGQAMWNGRLLVSGVTEAPFQIGNQTGHITYWPETYNSFNGAPRPAKLGPGDHPTGPRYVVNSGRMQNAHFNTLEEAQAGIEAAYNGEMQNINHPMYRGREDIYREAHFPDEPNYLWHTRQSLQKGPQGQTVLHGDELQSTRGQAIRDSGGARDEAKIAELQKRHKEASDVYQAALAEGQDFASKHGHMIQDKLPRELMPRELSGYDTGSILNVLYTDAADRNVGHTAFVTGNKMRNAANSAQLIAAELESASRAAPGHPLVNTTDQWTTTALRRLIQQAVEAKAEGISLTPGDLQNQRYSLETVLHNIRVTPQEDGSRTLQLARRDAMGRPTNRDMHDVIWVGPDGKMQTRDRYHDLEGQHVNEAFGRDVGDRIMTGKPREGSNSGEFTIDGEDLRAGGHGMRSFYDKIAPNRLDKELRRMDPQYPGRGQTELMREIKYKNVPIDEHIPHQGGPFHYFPLTQKIKDEVAKGLPLFSAAALMALMPQVQREKPELHEDNPFGYEQ